MPFALSREVELLFFSFVFSYKEIISDGVSAIGWEGTIPSSLPIFRKTGNQFPFCGSSSAGLETTDVDPFADFAEYGQKGQRQYSNPI
jgi:hypothetical protein